ncbi:hypothetical protein IW140_005352 [Coemansia sp. RSA 1813]|nr:hypothetical protein IW138_005350 [Coemansia sp. RSA 986]KAJ2565360.1 hypothetical protein IW140_005352 [Coemansia sp. RSA 1813]
MGIVLDPRSTADLVVVVLLSCIFAINLIAVMFLIFNHKYPPLKSKNPILMVIMFIASVFWFVGDMQVNGHVTLTGSVLTDCRGFGFWVRVLLGICTVTAVVAIRTYAFYHVFSLNLPLRSWRFFLPIVVYFVCILAFGIVAMALSPSKSAEYVPNLDICSLDEPFKITIFIFVWISLLFVALLTWMIRNIKSSFRETWEMFFACIVVLGSMTFNSAIQFTHPVYPLERKYRIASTLFDMACANALWWGVLAKPLFNCLFRREGYLREWISKLRQDGLQREYQVGSDHGQYLDQELIQPHDAYLYNNMQYTDSGMTFLKKPPISANEFFYKDTHEERMWQSEDNYAPAYPSFTGAIDLMQTNSQHRTENTDTRIELRQPHLSNGTRSISWQPSANELQHDSVYDLEDNNGRRIL